MGIPCVIKASGGLPVTVATNGYGLPMTVATNGFGIAVTQATPAGAGLAVTGITFGPTLQLTGNTVAENAAINTTVGTVSVTSGTTGTPAYTLTDSAGGKFNLSGSTLRVNAALDYETATSHNVTVSVSGLTPSVSAATFTVIVTDVDDTVPLITSANTASNVEGTVLAHALTANETVTWALVAGGADNARFEISGSTLRWLSNGVKDYETPNDADANNAYVVTLRATDTASNVSATQTVTVTVTDLTGATVTAPVLDLLTDGTDNTPDFELTGDLAVGDTVRFQYSTSAVFSGASETTNTIDAGEDAADEISFSTGTLANGTWYFRARIERPGSPEPGVSAWSNTETIAISVVTSAATVWSGSDKTANTTITGNSSGSIATCTDANWATVRSVDASTTDQCFYFENVQSAAGPGRLGISTTTTVVDSIGAPGRNSPSTAFYIYANGNVGCQSSVYDGYPITLNPPDSVGDEIDFAVYVNGSTRLLYARVVVGGVAGGWNDVYTAPPEGPHNPATGAGGIAIPFAGPYKAIWNTAGTGFQTTTRFAASSWIRTPPAGFTQLGS